jgi:hypothetical protein
MSAAVLGLLAIEQVALKRKKKTPKGEWVFNYYFLGDRASDPLPCCKVFYEYIEQEPLGLYEHFKSVEHVANANGQKPHDLQATIDENNKKYRRY